MLIKASLDDDGDVFVEAVGGWWEGLASHGATLQEAFTNFGEAAMLYAEMKNARPR